MVVLENQFREKGVIGMKKVLAMGVAACMAVSMLAGCGAASSTANSGAASGAASAAAGGEGQLSVSWWGGERGVPLSKADREAAEAAGTLNEMVAEANAVVVENAEFTLDYHFEDASLKNTDGIYYDVMGGLSYGDYDVAAAAEILIDGTNEVLGA